MALSGSPEAQCEMSSGLRRPSAGRRPVLVHPRAAGAGAKFSPFRSFDFDTAVFLVFAAPTFALTLARELSAEEVNAIARFSAHTNGKQPTLRQVQSAGVDVTDEMARAYSALDNTPEPPFSPDDTA
jgi:hypothetical protein